jgi:hypothetical protein
MVEQKPPRREFSAAVKRLVKNSIFDGVPCANEECERQAVTRCEGVAVCNRHYQQFRNCGRWDRPDKKRRHFCSVSGCDLPVRSTHAEKCETHYYRDRRGSELGDGPIKPPCPHCGSGLTKNQSKFCSDKCGRDFHYVDIKKRLARWNGNHKADAKREGLDYEDVDLFAMFEDANWTCYLCDEEIDPGVRWPNRDCASVDHEIPKRAGGGHTKKNCRPSHFKCNFKKSHTTDKPLITKAKRLRGETGQYKRRKARGGSSIQCRGFQPKPDGYVSPLSKEGRRR